MVRTPGEGDPEPWAKASGLGGELKSVHLVKTRGGPNRGQVTADTEDGTSPSRSSRLFLRALGVFLQGTGQRNGAGVWAAGASRGQTSVEKRTSKGCLRPGPAPAHIRTGRQGLPGHCPLGHRSAPPSQGHTLQHHSNAAPPPETLMFPEEFEKRQTSFS